MTNEELVELYQQGDKQALELIIEQNRGIVYKIVNKFYIEGTSSIDKEDLEQEGFIGLMIAADKYNPDMENKAKFITYAVNWIYQKIHRFVRYKNTNDETSLNVPIGEDGDMELQSTIQDTENAYENLEEQIYLKELRSELERGMNQYNTLKEREVLKCRYGWDIKPMTLNEVGELYEVTGNDIRCIQARALRKLRNNKWIKVMAKEYYTQRISDLNDKASRTPERVVGRMALEEEIIRAKIKAAMIE